MADWIVVYLSQHIPDKQPYLAVTKINAPNVQKLGELLAEKHYIKQVLGVEDFGRLDGGIRLKSLLEQTPERVMYSLSSKNVSKAEIGIPGWRE